MHASPRSAPLPLGTHARKVAPLTLDRTYVNIEENSAAAQESNPTFRVQPCPACGLGVRQALKATRACGHTGPDSSVDVRLY